MTTKRELLELIRKNCSECVGGPRACSETWPVRNPNDIAICSSTTCAFYMYRYAKDPFPNKIRQKQAKKAFGKT